MSRYPTSCWKKTNHKAAFILDYDTNAAILKSIGGLKR